jgi:hypothetical protein
MPITINGSGTLTGISTGGLPDGCIATDDLANNAVTTAKMGSGEASGLCKAWVNFNGTGTVAIRASYNVSSIIDNGTGNYTVNFTTAMADANFSAVATGTQDGFTVSTNSSVGLGGLSTTQVSFLCRNNADTAYADYATVCVAIFR